MATKRLAFGTRHRDSRGSALIDRDLDASRFPSPRFVDLLEKRLTLGGVRATLDFDVFNALIAASTLRQFSDAATTTFRSPLEIVAPGSCAWDCGCSSERGGTYRPPSTKLGAP